MSSSVPEGWGSGLLSDFSEVNPKLSQRATLKPDTPVSFIRMEDVSNEAVVKNVRVEEYQKVAKGFTAFQDSDVLVAKITPCFENGKGGYVSNLKNGVGFGSTEFHVLRSRSNSAPGYLYQFSTFHEFRLSGEANMTGSAGQRRVPTDYLKTLDVVFPPLPEQQKIAAILSSVDDVIEETRAQIDKLKDLKTGMMQELLTKGIGHTAFKDSPVGRIPEGWDVFELGEIAKVKGGKRMPKGRPFSDHVTPHPYIRVSDFSNGTIRLENLKYVLPKDQESIKRYTISKDDLYISIAGTIGVVGSVPEVLDGAQLTENAAKIVFNDLRGICLSFVKHLMCSNEVQDRLNQEKGTGGGVPKLALFRIESTLIQLPPFPEQKAIGSALDSIDYRLDSANQKLAALEMTKKALMQDLLTGKVRVNVDNKENAVA